MSAPLTGPALEQEPRRVRLRPGPDADELAALYTRPYNHRVWSDHRERVAATVEFVRVNLPFYPGSIADLSTGDGTIPQRIAEWAESHTGVSPSLYLGDYSSGWSVRGLLEDTIRGMPPVDLWVCSETVEHLGEPEAVLRAGRVARWLLLTTPCDEWDPAGNPEHVWGWNVTAMRDLLVGCGWDPFAHTTFLPVTQPYYRFQMWLCRQ